MRREEEKIMPSLMATSLSWRTHSARTNILSDENSFRYRFILKNIADIEVFKSKVRQSFLATV
jgi:hypothetical protein